MTPLPPPERYTFNCALDGSCWPYLLQLPPGEPQAIVVNLYGHYGDEWQGMTEGIYEDAFGKLRRECLRREWVYVCARYGGNSWMGPIAEAGMVDLIVVLRERWPQLPLYLMGGSMGGSSALVFAVRRPELLAGVVALCPAADVEEYYHWCWNRVAHSPTLGNIANAIRIHYGAACHDLQRELQLRSALKNAGRLTMPVYLRHGDADELIPVEWTRQLAARLKALSRQVQYEEIPGGGHDAPIHGIDWGAVLDAVSG